MRLTLLCLVLMLSFSFGALAQAQDNECAVSANYIEAVEENTSAVLRINILLNSGGGPLNNIDTARVNYKQLISMRNYHEDQRELLPECAQATNTALIDTIVTAQDLFGVLFLQGLDAENFQLYDNDLRQAAAALRQNFAVLNEESNATVLVPDEDA